MQVAIRSAVEWPRAERLDIVVQALGKLADLRLRHPGDPKGLDQLIDPPGRDAKDVCLGDDLGDRPLGAPARW